MAFNKYLLFTLVVIAANTLGNFCYEYELNSQIEQDVISIYTHQPVLPADTYTYSKVKPSDVQLYLFTADNPQKYIVIDKDRPSEKLKGPEKIVFIVHGWLGSREVSWYENMKNEFLLSKQDKYKVIQVDWRKPAKQIYSQSAANTRDVGDILGQFIVKMKQSLGISTQQSIVVGHSLGGQVAGFTGKRLYRILGEKLPRVVALDPAGPLFNGRPEDQRVSPNDAKVVHVIHTDGGTFGMKNPTGTIDFFPNGGSSQPGCFTYDLNEPTTTSSLVVCSHQRGWMYFIEAIGNSKAFLSKRCESWKDFKAGRCENVQATMGDLKGTLKGKFYLETNKKSPFSKTRQGFEYDDNLMEFDTL